MNFITNNEIKQKASQGKIVIFIPTKTLWPNTTNENNQFISSKVIKIADCLGINDVINWTEVIFKSQYITLQFEDSTQAKAKIKELEKIKDLVYAELWTNGREIRSNA
ncbi:hypothetical protein [Halanaerobacter jeridensis]|uniref:Uncharacterized protein n=1 Tax=Halanaerobacter jeridensis TaxID=706427 RepID=A0A938XXT2_9FIRM|nr:hypothetical protein [Halanaerobacter jeridensis]MBM7557627.1 hypothetical protein [Halanaerobacter jeridensis]